MLMLALAIALLCIAAVVLSAPLFGRRLEPYAMQRPQADPREAERTLEALSELEQSRSSGKLSEPDYAAQRERLEADYLRAVAGLRGDPG